LAAAGLQLTAYGLEENLDNLGRLAGETPGLVLCSMIYMPETGRIRKKRK
jgi:hypothetical protein